LALLQNIEPRQSSSHSSDGRRRPASDSLLREIFNDLRLVERTGAPWRWMPHDLTPWNAVYQQETGETVEIAYVNQGHTGESAADEAGEHGSKLEVIKLPTAKREVVLLPCRWVSEVSAGCHTLDT
jgi:transposase